MLLVIISPFCRSMNRPGMSVDSGVAAAQATQYDRQHPKRVPEGQSDRGAAGFTVFPLALQIPERFRGIGLVKDVPAGGLVKDAVHVWTSF